MGEIPKFGSTEKRFSSPRSFDLDPSTVGIIRNIAIEFSSSELFAQHKPHFESILVNTPVVVNKEARLPVKLTQEEVELLSYAHLQLYQLAKNHQLDCRTDYMRSLWDLNMSFYKGEKPPLYSVFDRVLSKMREVHDTDLDEYDRKSTPPDLENIYDDYINSNISYLLS